MFQLLYLNKSTWLKSHQGT